MDKLQSSFDRLKILRFPESTDDADLQDLHAELAELDGYIAGLVSSRIKGKTVKFDLNEVIAPIESLLKEAAGSQNQTALSALRDYYRGLKEVAKVLARES